MPVFNYLCKIDNLVPDLNLKAAFGVMYCLKTDFLNN